MNEEEKKKNSNIKIVWDFDIEMYKGAFCVVDDGVFLKNTFCQDGLSKVHFSLMRFFFSF